VTVFFYTLIFFLPLLVLPLGVSFFETPKVILAELLIELLVLLTLFKAKFNLKFLITFPGFAVSIILFLSIIDLIFLKTETTFFGNAFRLQGIFLLWHLLAFAFISSRTELPKKACLFSLFSLIILALSVYIFGGDINGRAFGTLGEANSLAGAAIFFLPFGLTTPKKWVKFSALILVFLIILASGSRTGALGFLILTIFFGLIYIFKLKLPHAFIVALFISIMSLFLPIYAGGGWYENRAEIWYTSLVAGATSPVLGHGFGNMQSALHQTSLILNNNIQYLVVDSAHNIFLDFWIQGGFLGVLALGLLVIYSIRVFLKRNQTLELMILLGLLITLSFNPVSVSLLVGFWWVLGQGFKKV